MAATCCATRPRWRSSLGTKSIRLPGPITREALDVLRKADRIYLEEIRSAGLYDKIWQAFAVLLPVRSVGVMGDGTRFWPCAR